MIGRLHISSQGPLRRWEEFTRQIDLCTKRLGISNADLTVVLDSQLEQILTLPGLAVKDLRYNVIIIDSINDRFEFEERRGRPRIVKQYIIPHPARD